MPQQAPALRHAPPVYQANAAQRIGFGLGVFQKTQYVARPSQARSHHARIAGAVHDIVNAPGLEAAIQRHRSSVDKVPSFARNALRRIGRQIAHGHEIVRARGIEGLVGLVVAIRHRRRRRALTQNDVPADQAGDRGAMIGGNRHVHAHLPLGHIPLPAHPEQRISLRHKRAIAEFSSGRRIAAAFRFLKHGEHRLAAAIAYFVEQASVAARGVDRLEQIKIRRELDFALGVARSQSQVDDARILRQRGIERELRRANQLFVRPRLSKRFAVEHGLPALDAQPHDASLRRQRHQHHENNRPHTDPSHHV